MDEPEMYWCPACKSYHVDPTSKEHHAKLQCRAVYKLSPKEILKAAETKYLELKAQGWTQKDFARELGKMLNGE